MRWYALQSVHNHGAQRYLSGRPLYADWEITILFYSALHAINEHLFSMGEPRSHSARNKLVYAKMPHVRREYYALYALCRKVGYDVSYAEVSEADRQIAIGLHSSIRLKLNTGAYTHDQK